MAGVVLPAGTRVHFRLERNENGFIAENIDTEDKIGVCMT
jgi:hypothetical protein